MEFSINVATSDIKITLASNDYSERELKFIEVLMLNIVAPANALVTGVDMALNSFEKEENVIFHTQLAWQKSLDESLYNELEESLYRRIETALKMSKVDHATITFNVNSYMTT